ncbi:Outer membrane efflux protein [compost metagenome]
MRARCSLALLLLLATPAGAAWGHPLTHEELSTQAIAHSPVITAMDLAIEAAKARAEVSGARSNPSLVGQVQLSPTADHNQFTLGFRQLLDFRGLASQRRAQAEEEVEILALQRARLKQEVAAQAQEAYWQAWLARTELQRKTRDLDWQRDELSRVRKRLDVGTASRHELVDAGLDLLEAELAQRNAEQQAKGQLARMNFLLGRAVDAPLELAEPKPELGTLAPLSVWIDEAQLNRPEPRQVAIARRREIRGIRLAESLSFGEGELEAQAGTAANSDPLLYGAFDLPIPLWNRHEGERRAAGADAARLEVELLASRQAISQEVLKAYYAAVEARSRFVDVNERLIPHAEHLVEKAEDRVKLGAANRTELQSARHAFSQAESERAKAHLDYQLSLLRLQTAVGR